MSSMKPAKRSSVLLALPVCLCTVHDEGLLAEVVCNNEVIQILSGASWSGASWSRSESVCANYCVQNLCCVVWTSELRQARAWTALSRQITVSDTQATSPHIQQNKARKKQDWSWVFRSAVYRYTDRSCLAVVYPRTGWLRSMVHACCVFCCHWTGIWPLYSDCLSAF